MRLCCFVRMMSCLKRMGMRAMRMLGSLLGMPRSMLRRGFLVVLRRLLVMLGGFKMMAISGMLAAGCFLRHVCSPNDVRPECGINRPVP
jgi:hypothetical protein